MTIFELVKASITPRDAAERYGLTVDRHGRTRCPFHPDHRPSMKLNPDYFYCFTCHESGDVTKLTAQLLGSSQYEAAKRLAADFGLTRDAPPLARPVPRRITERDALKDLSTLLVHLKSIKLEQAPLNPDVDFDERFIQSCLMEESVQYLLDLLSSNMADERAYALDRYRHEPIIQQAKALVTQYTKEGGFAVEHTPSTTLPG